MVRMESQNNCTTTISKTLVFFVNGAKIEDGEVYPEWTLAKYLREKLSLTGTKLACEEGACGSCTVGLAKYNPVNKKPTYGAVNACLVPIFLVHGRAVVTVEGVGSVNTGLHPIQERLAKGHGSQCGFCTPGFVMAFYCLLRNNPQPTAKEIETAVAGNLCRCTGYRPILESFYSFGKDCCNKGAQCCKNAGNKSNDNNLVNWTSFPKYDTTQEPIFPPELQLANKYQNQTLILNGPRMTCYSPVTVAELMELLRANPDGQLVGAGTLMGLIERGGNNPHSVWISIARIGDWKSAKLTEEGLEVGAARTITGLLCAIQSKGSSLPENKTHLINGIAKCLSRLGSAQLRNVCLWSGNLGTGSSVSDINVPFLAAKCQVHVISVDGKERWIDIDQDFFTGKWDRKLNIEKTEVIDKVRIPLSSKDEYFVSYKQTMRPGNDQGVVTCAFWIKFDKNDVVSDVRLAFGGMSNRPVMALKTQQLIIGHKWNENLLENALKSLSEEMKLPSSAPGGRHKYKTNLCLTFMFRFYTEIRECLERKESIYSHLSRSEENQCCFSPIQIYNDVPEGQLDSDSVGRPLMHQYGDKHTTGEANYVSDIVVPNMLHLALVQSKRAHANAISIDPSEALKVPGVVAYIDVQDIPSNGTNIPGCDNFVIQDDTQVFADGIVTCEGQAIGAIAADDVTVARRAVQLVEVEYEDLAPILTIEEAIKANSYMGPLLNKCKGGDINEALEKCEMQLSGEIKIGGQEHLYLETQSTVVIPGESDTEFEIWSSAQWITLIQELTGRLLGIPTNGVCVRAKRVGGAFGGKVSQSVYSAAPAIVAANKLRRPVKCYLSRKEDMLATGGRHPCICKYTVGFTSTGHIQALKYDAFVNGGHKVDSSCAVTSVVVNRIEHCYNIPVVTVNGGTVKTNTRSNTAFRGFGFPQAHYFMDSIIERIGENVGIAPDKIREINFNHEGYCKLTGNVVANNLVRCWQECRKWSDYENVLTENEKFNKEGKYRKRGVSLVPVQWEFGGGGFFKQGGALVHIYMDGSVLVSIGGVEMGQGLNIKCLQIASRVLELPIERITIEGADVTKVPNNIETGGSQGSDVLGLAVKDACEKLLNRLKPVMKEKPEGLWEDWVKSAFMNRISLSATGHGTPGQGITAEGYRYFTVGAAMTNVEIDCLTGDHKILASDIVMDVGDSLNPAVDIGQIEGAYIQGCGLFTTEELVHSSDGRLLTNAVGSYKIPTVASIPRQFRVALLKNPGHTENVYSSKGIGEPPLCLGMGVFFALNQAITAARIQNGFQPLFHLESPLTAERIRMACEDNFTKLV